MQVLALAIQEGVPDPATKIKAFRAQYKLTYPILSDEKAIVMQRFGFSGIPSNVILDKQGKYVANVDSLGDMDQQLKKLTK